MIAPAAAVAPTTGAGPPDPGAQPAHAWSFHQVLSALNPLQYLPVIGTIYRAITGDTIPEPVRRIGSLIASALLGGPIGIAINLGLLAAEKATGIDIDSSAQALLRGEPVNAAAPNAGEDAAAPAVEDAPTPEPVRQPWSPVQLAAYGVTTATSGSMRLDGLEGADVLNALELSRIQSAHAAYARL